MRNLKIQIITGLSGSGKTTVLDIFEDSGFYCVDNMPAALLPKFLELPVKTASDVAGLAFVMDMRETDFLRSFPSVFRNLKKQRYNIEILFLEAGENILIQRYSQTRRHHPLSGDKGLLQGIRMERDLMKEIRAMADRIIDTSGMTIHDLKAYILKLMGNETAKVQMNIHVMSFGYKYGIPHEADIIIDVRFLPNPHFHDDMRPLDGTSEKVRRYVLENETGKSFLQKFLNLIDFLVPLYKNEPKAYLTLAIGCTGGRHRSVAVATAVYEHMKNIEPGVKISHRDIGHEA